MKSGFIAKIQNSKGLCDQRISGIWYGFGRRMGGGLCRMYRRLKVLTYHKFILFSYNMQHIILSTPPDKENSNFSAHIIEHIKLHDDMMMPGYFEKLKFRGNTYADYTIYTIESDNPEVLSQFIELLVTPIDRQVYFYEKKVIHDEVSYRSIHKQIIEKVGKYFRGQSYKYTRMTRSTLESINEYHQKYYTIQNIKILTEHIQKKDIEIANHSNIHTLSIDV